MVLTTALVATGIAYVRVKTNVESSDATRFADRSQSAVDAIQEGLDSYASTVRAIAGLFEASDDVQPEEWKRFIDSMALTQRHPALRSIGFAPIITRTELPAYQEHLRTLLRTNVVIAPSTGEEFAAPTTYLEQFGGAHDKRLGWDAMADPRRAAALQQMLKTRQPTVTRNHFFSVDPEPLPGFLVYYPVFGRSAEVSARPIVGIVFSSFVPQRMVRAFNKNQADPALRLELYAAATLESGTKASSKRMATSQGAEEVLGKWLQTNAVSIFGERFAVRVAALPAFALQSDSHLPRLTLFGGLVFSFLLFAIAWTQVAAHQASERMNRRLLMSEEQLTAANRALERKVAEQKVTEDMLAHERDLLRTLLDHSPDRIYFKDKESRFIKCGRTITERLGIKDSAAAVGKTDFDFFQPEHAKAAFETEQEVMRTGKPVIGLVEEETWINGEQTWALTSKMPLRDKEGNIVGTFGISKDITQLKKTEAELLRASKLESIGVLAGGIAHDFNNILTVILGNISLARMLEDNLPKPVVNVLTEAEKASLRARDLTQRLLTFAKGGAPIKRAVAPGPLLRECTQAALQGTNINYQFYIREDLWPVEADEGQLAQVFHNLVQHARQAGGDNPSIEVYASNQEIESDPLLFVKPGRYVRVSIRDHGAGLAPEQLNNIFDPYFSAKKQAQGLELATAYSIVRKHEGQIRVESVAGEGTVFHVYLPAAHVAVTPELPKRSAPRPTATGRVLVMDDEPAIRHLATMLLRKAGFTPEVAADGAEAISKYDSARQSGEPFAAVIMDLTVPNGMGGVEAMRQLRTLDPAVKAIVSSGYSTDPVMANFREYGFSGVVPKPYNADDLAIALGDVLADSVQTETARTDTTTTS